MRALDHLFPPAAMQNTTPIPHLGYNIPMEPVITPHDLICAGSLFFYGSIYLATVYRQRECRSPAYLLSMLFFVAVWTLWALFQLSQRMCGYYTDTICLVAGFLIWRKGCVRVPRGYQSVAIFVWYGDTWPVTLDGGLYLYLPFSFRLLPLLQPFVNKEARLVDLRPDVPVVVTTKEETCFQLNCNGGKFNLGAITTRTKDDWDVRWLSPRLAFTVKDAVHWLHSTPCGNPEFIRENMRKIFQTESKSFPVQKFRTPSGLEEFQARLNGAVDAYCHVYRIDLAVASKLSVPLNVLEITYAGRNQLPVLQEDDDETGIYEKYPGKADEIATLTRRLDKLSTQVGEIQEWGRLLMEQREKKRPLRERKPVRR